MRIREILRSKGDDVVTVGPDVAVPEAMKVLVRHNIGALVVWDDALRGIITERDLLRAGADDPRRLAETRVEDLMTREVVTGSPDAELREVMEIMTRRRIRHLPIAAEGELQGMISIGDVVNALLRDTEAENRHLHSYIAGTPA